MIEIEGVTALSSYTICQQLLDTSRWTEFTGYAILPGIRQAAFELRTPEVLGSRIRVHNTDGSTHVEEIIEWDPARRVALKFQEFSPPLQHLAAYFIESWEFYALPGGTRLVRRMAMQPRGLAGRLLLPAIAPLMKKAFQQQALSLPAAQPAAPSSSKDAR